MRMIMAQAFTKSAKSLLSRSHRLHMTRAIRAEYGQRTETGDGQRLHVCWDPQDLRPPIDELVLMA
jgi:hypothetical protein